MKTEKGTVLLNEALDNMVNRIGAYIGEVIKGLSIKILLGMNSTLFIIILSHLLVWLKLLGHILSSTLKRKIELFYL